MLEPVKFLNFLAIVISSWRAMNKSGGVTVRVLANLLAEDGKDEYDAQEHSVTATSPLQATCPYLLYALLARFLTDAVLHVAHHALITSKKGAMNEAMKLPRRMFKTGHEF